MGVTGWKFRVTGFGWDSPWVGLGWELRKREMKAEGSSGNWGQNGGDKFS